MIDVDRNELLIESAFEYWRKHGFPYPEYSDAEIWQDFFKLQDTVIEMGHAQIGMFEEFEPNTLGKHISGIDAATHFHPHIWDSHAIKMKAPTESFESDKLLRRACWLALTNDQKITRTTLRRALRIVSGTQMCSNFRPAAARSIYDQFHISDNGDVLDPSTGYGGRLTGFLASRQRGRYIGVDPSTLTHKGNIRLAKFFNSLDRVRLYNSPFEDMQEDELKKYNIELVFTSPPYFKKEIYTEEGTQSAHRYPEIDSWLNNFWSPSLQKISNVIQQNATVVINIQDVNIGSKSHPLVDETIKRAEESGMYLNKRWDMKFSSFGKNLKKKKTEAVLVFKKTNGAQA